MKRPTLIAPTLARLDLSVARSLRFGGPLIALVALAAAACAGDGRSDEPELVPQILSSDRAVGRNVFSAVLTTVDREPVLGAEVHVRFFRSMGEQEVAGEEAELRPTNVVRSYTESHPGIPSHTHEADKISV